MIMEAKRPSVSWRTKKACGVIQFESPNLRTKEVNSISPRWNPKAQEPRAPKSMVESGNKGQ